MAAACDDIVTDEILLTRASGCCMKNTTSDADLELFFRCMLRHRLINQSNQRIDLSVPVSFGIRSMSVNGQRPISKIPIHAITWSRARLATLHAEKSASMYPVRRHFRGDVLGVQVAILGGH